MVRLQKKSPGHRHCSLQLGLEDVVLVLGPQFLLGVDEKQCDEVMGVPLADFSLNIDVGKLWNQVPWV